MRSMRPIRFIPYASYGASWNMAADEYLMDSYRERGMPTFRLYGWDPPALSIGRYQDIKEINTEQCLQLGIPIVRRITGGGAIYHGNELTYSLVCSDGDTDTGTGTIPDSYRWLNGFILEMYRSMGLEATLAKNGLEDKKFGGHSPSCFSGNEGCDILIGGKKIGGNAQRRMRGIILQHGSIPLSIDRDLIQGLFTVPVDDSNFTALEEATGREVTPDEAAGKISAALTRALGFSLSEKPLNKVEVLGIKYLDENKYRSSQWTEKGEREHHDAAAP